MSQLSLYRPPVEIEDDDPQVLSFTDYSARRRSRQMVNIVMRARLERTNSQCPCCRRVTVQPIELRDAVTNRNGATVPGTATVVGFKCNACRHEWPVLDRA
ncbi:MAG: hypothetical protein KDA93_12770 [Planctomycetaceae bacterium]|nr:hypothetical protein [Planctomycetaceae bacterium]